MDIITLDDDLEPETAGPSKPKKKRRTKEEIEQEKLEKEIKKIHREMNAAKNAKCEQFLFCYVDRSICLLDDVIQTELSNRFTERAIPDQISYVDGNYGIGRVVWKRKRVDALIEDGKVRSLQTMDVEGPFVHVIDSSTFEHLVKSGGLQEFIARITKEHQHTMSVLNLVVLGQTGAHSTLTTTSVLECFEEHRSQVRYCRNALEFSFLIAQLHRAIAKSQKKLEQATDVPVIDMEKGIREGLKRDLRTDWWTRMLSHVHRLSEEQKRAVVNQWPDPFEFMDELILMKPDEAVKMIAEVKGGNQRRIGPVIARTIYTLMTSKNGDDIILDT